MAKNDEFTLMKGQAVAPFEAEQTAETVETAMVVKSDLAGVDLMEQLKNPNSNFFCSIKDDGSVESKIDIYNAVNSADESLSDHIGEVLEVRDVVAYPVRLMDEETGELLDALRTVLVTADGKTYSAVSGGITNSLSRIFSIVGLPNTWTSPLKMKVKQVKTRNGNNKVNTIELVK